MKKDNLKRTAYPTDLTDEQWEVIAPLFKGMREYKYSKRELLNAVLYLVDNGCKWRALPHEFPAWQTVYSFFRRAKETGLWDKILQHLVKVTRRRAGRNPTNREYQFFCVSGIEIGVVVRFEIGLTQNRGHTLPKSHLCYYRFAIR